MVSQKDDKSTKMCFLNDLDEQADLPLVSQDAGMLPLQYAALSLNLHTASITVPSLQVRSIEFVSLEIFTPENSNALQPSLSFSVMFCNVSSDSASFSRTTLFMSALEIGPILKVCAMLYDVKVPEIENVLFSYCFKSG